MSRIIYACDVGSTRRPTASFGWARVESNEPQQTTVGTDIAELVESLRSDLASGYSLPLGFESPLFIPVPDHKEELSERRDGEGNRSWSAPPGGYVTTLGLHQCAWIIRELSDFASKVTPTLDCARWQSESEEQLLFLWEAFVSGEAHAAGSGQHVADARNAALSLIEGHNVHVPQRTHNAANVLSLAGSALLWSGWSHDISMLKQPTIIVKPTDTRR
jgi:hypothetical protein